MATVYVLKMWPPNIGACPWLSPSGMVANQWDHALERIPIETVVDFHVNCRMSGLLPPTLELVNYFNSDIYPIAFTI